MAIETVAEVLAGTVGGGAVTVGPDDYLVINLGLKATAQDADYCERLLRERHPGLSGRVVIVAAEQIGRVVR